MAQSSAPGSRRVWVPAAVFGAFALLLLGRLVQLQILDHTKYAQAAHKELLGDDIIYAHRGSILDRNGNVLATSVDTWDIYVNSRAWKDPLVAAKASATMAKILSADPSHIRNAVAQPGVAEKDRQVDVRVLRDVDFDLGKLLISNEVPGVVALPSSVRINPEGDTAASVLGFIGGDKTGLAGIEAAYQDQLQGKPGRAIYERDTTGDPIPFGVHITDEPQPGTDLVLTLDRYLQRMAERALDQAIKEHRATGGAIIMMDPNNGEILALATSPGLKYSTLDLSDAKQLELLRNRAVTDLYEPGSVMKVVTASSAIDKGVVTPDTSYYDSGVAKIYDTELRNWDNRSYGNQTMTGVLQNSINTGAVFMMQKLGTDTFLKYIDAFGFGKPSGIDLTGEASGIFRKKDDPEWTPVDPATQAFGQSISVTPIQMITAIAASINGGELLRPHLVRATVDGQGVRHEIGKEVLGHPITATTSATMRGMLFQVVEPPELGHPAQAPCM